jgi:transcriptional regulator GlxA family with amidase domain
MFQGLKGQQGGVVDSGRIITAGGIASGMEMGLHLLRRAGYDETSIYDVARVMEYHAAYECYRNDIEYFNRQYGSVIPPLPNAKMQKAITGLV